MLFFYFNRLLFFALFLAVGTSIANAQQLSTPKTLSFSTTLDHASSFKELTLRNTGTEKLIIDRLVLKGEDANSFVLQTQLTFPFEIAAKKSRKLSFYFSPKTKQSPVIIEADLVIESNVSPQRIMLKGLVAEGLEGEKEPPLQLIVETLGYSVDVGSGKLQMDIGQSKLGAEVQASMFIRAETGKPVVLIPVARYSPAAAVPVGYYFRNKNNELRYVKTATLSKSGQQHQTIYPELASGNIAFKPVDIPFGIFVSTESGALYSEDKLNEQAHALRVYPLNDSHDKNMPNSYLICFEEASNGDYQDYVFVLKNVSIAEIP